MTILINYTEYTHAMRDSSRHATSGKWAKNRALPLLTGSGHDEGGILTSKLPKLDSGDDVGGVDDVDEVLVAVDIHLGVAQSDHDGLEALLGMFKELHRRHGARQRDTPQLLTLNTDVSNPLNWCGQLGKVRLCISDQNVCGQTIALLPATTVQNTHYW